MIAVERCVNEMEVAMAVVPKRNADRKEVEVHRIAGLKLNTDRKGDVDLSLVDLGGVDLRVGVLNVAAARVVASFD